jgi:hypothetical protein
VVSTILLSVVCLFWISKLAFVFSSRLCLEVESAASGNSAAIYLKNYWMFAPVFALTYLNMTWFYSARARPYSSVTSRSGKSILLANTAMMAP